MSPQQMLLCQSGCVTAVPMTTSFPTPSYNKKHYHIKYALFSCSDVARHLKTVHFNWASTPYGSLQHVYLAIFRYSIGNKKTGIATKRPLLLFNLNCSRMKNDKISLYSLYYSYYWHYFYCSHYCIFFGHSPLLFSCSLRFLTINPKESIRVSISASPPTTISTEST